MSDIRLTTPLVRVTLGNPDDQATWQQLEVRTVNKDQIKAETELAMGKRGTVAEHPILWATALAFYALKRTGQLSQGSFAAFEDGCIEVKLLDDEDDVADPTQPELVTG